jgi:spore germination protein YaaH
MTMRGLRIVLAVAVTAAAAPALPTSSDAAALGHAADACGTLRLSALTFSRALGKTSGTLRWHRRGRGGKLSYRVLRNGRVVGQTAKQSIRVRVSLDHRYRFTVVPLGPGGKGTRCAKTKRIHIAYRPPGAPRYLTVTGDERGLRLTWRKARRGDAKLAGYRVLRDGKTVGQRAGTSWALPAAPNRSYRFTVVAVDRHGRASAPSKPVTAVTSHEPPTAPSDLRAAPVSESSIQATWQPSTVKAGHVTTYRVLRDDAVVGQVGDTARLLDNLAPSTDYRVSVVAIDDYGYASAPATVAARTLDPVPTTGHAHAFMLASTDQSFADLRAHYQQIGVLYPTYYDCTGAAKLEGDDDAHITQWAQARKVEVLPRVNCQRTAVVNQILTDPQTRARWLDQLVGLARDRGYDGISIDFEAGPASARAAMTSFIQELARRLHDDGRVLAMAVSAKTRDSLTHPRSGIFDYPKLGDAADYVFLMAWGIHWSSSAPGPQDDLTWVKQVVDYVASLPQRGKFIFGTNLYALDWPNGGGPDNVATAYEYEELVPFLPALGASIELDPDTDNYHAAYTDAAGVPRDVWYPDAVTTGRRLALARAAGLGGVGFWRLGREDQRLWENPLLAPGLVW